MALLDNDGINLLQALLTTNSISSITPLSGALGIPADRIYFICQRYPQIFFRLNAEPEDRIACILDLSTCTFYSKRGPGCQKQNCSYLHLCSSVILPNRRCRITNCPLSHDLYTEHNRRILSERGLDNLPQNVIIMLILSSADPNKTFMICHRKPKPCQDQDCFKLHFCYFYLLNPTSCKFDNCRAGHQLTSQRNADYLDKRGLKYINAQDVLQLFRAVDDQKKRSHSMNNADDEYQQQQQPYAQLVTVAALGANTYQQLLSTYYQLQT